VRRVTPHSWTLPRRRPVRKALARPSGAWPGPRRGSTIRARGGRPPPSGPGG
jgi:hypothetical protein